MYICRCDSIGVAYKAHVKGDYNSSLTHLFDYKLLELMVDAFAIRYQFGRIDLYIEM